jgi:hypothetical protein
MYATGFDRYDFYDRLERVASEFANEIRSRIGPSSHLFTHGGTLNWAGSDLGQRVSRVRRAIEDSQSIAFRSLQKKLGGIRLDDVWPMLLEICHDVALYLGGGAIAGATIGGGLGFVTTGVGVVPGVIAGTALGAKIGGMLMGLIGLKDVVEYMLDNVPLAIAEYQKGFLDAWGPTPSIHDAPWDREPSRYYFDGTGFAAGNFARGHEIIVVALMMGIVTYLGRGKGNLKGLLADATSHPRLGPKFATWLEQNERKLSSSPVLQVRREGGGQATGKDSGPVLASQLSKSETTKPVAGLERSISGSAGHSYADKVLPGGSGKAVAGHGELRSRSDVTTVPEGSSITLPRTGVKILDETGQYIERGDWVGLAIAAKRNPRIASDLNGMTTWLPGSTVPNYTLKAPTGLNIHLNSVTVVDATSLKEILSPNMGNVCWAACTAFRY